MLKDQPQNRNFLSPLGFVFTILNKPSVNFFTQEANLPGMNIPSTQQPNPFVKIPKSGDHINFNDLKIRFKVDEDLQNYLEIYNWLKALGKDESFNQYQKLSSQPTYTGNGISSDISLIILNSVKKPNFEIIYKDAFPTSLSDLDFNTTAPDIEFVNASVVFKYTYHDIKQIT